MKALSNRLLGVATLALETAEKHLPAYSHSNSPKTYTQPQLLACLVLKTYLKTTYRGIIEVLDVSEKLIETLKLKALPDHSTLKYFAARVDLDTLLPLVFADIVGKCSLPTPQGRDK